MIVAPATFSPRRQWQACSLGAKTAAVSQAYNSREIVLTTGFTME